jgi:hypothetical protein
LVSISVVRIQRHFTDNSCKKVAARNKHKITRKSKNKLSSTIK